MIQWFCVLQRVLSKDSNLLSKTPSGMQSGGEEEQDEEAHTPLPPPMEIIIKDPSAQDEKVSWDKGQPGAGWGVVGWLRFFIAHLLQFSAH